MNCDLCAKKDDTIRMLAERCAGQAEVIGRHASKTEREQTVENKPTRQEHLLKEANSLSDQIKAMEVKRDQALAMVELLNSVTPEQRIVLEKQLDLIDHIRDPNKPPEGYREFQKYMQEDQAQKRPFTSGFPPGLIFAANQQQLPYMPPIPVSPKFQ